MIIHYFKMALRSLMRYKIQNIISMAGLVLSLTCVFILVRYIHQEYTANHFIPDWERTYFTTVVINNKQQISDSYDINKDSNYRNPLDDASVESFTRFVMIEDYAVKVTDESVPVSILAVDSVFFDFFPYPCLKGNALISPNEALITEDFSRKLFGDANPIGKTMQVLSGKIVTVAGVLGEPSTKSSLKFDVILSKELEDWSRVQVEVVRLHRKEDVEALNRKNSTPMQLISFGKESVYYKLESLDDIYFNKNIEIYFNNFIRGNQDVIYLHIIISFLILLVGLFNYINLYTAVVQKRSRELCVKKIFGAGRFQVFSQLYVENVIFNAITLFFVWLIVEITRNVVSYEFGIPVLSDGYFDILISGLVLLILPLVVLIYPYFRLLYNVPVRTLKIVSGKNEKLVSRFIFLFMQYVITFGLTVAAIYFSIQLKYLYNTDVGYNTENIIRCKFMRETHTSRGNFDKVDEIKSNYSVLEKKISESPLFNGMAYGDSPYNIDYDVNFTDSRGKTVKSLFFYCSKEYMDFFGFNIIDGRGWNSDDSFTQYKMIVNKAFLDAFELKDWRGESFQPDRRLWWAVGESSEKLPYEIVGVMDDFRTGHLSGPNMPMIFVFEENSPTFDVFFSIVDGKEKEAIALLQKLYNDIFDKGELEYSFLEDDIKKLHENDRKLMLIVITFAMIAVCISCLGLFGLSLYDIRQRYREIGLRKIHGAGISDIYRLIMRKYILVMLIAYVVGTLASYVIINRYMESVVHKAPLSGWIFIVSGVLVFVVVAATLYWQTSRAARINPADVIRSE